jgi:acetyl-CoA acetyltransferase
VAGKYGVTRERQHQWALRSHRLASRKAAFRQGGTVTGGNSSPLNDDAALWEERSKHRGPSPPGWAQTGRRGFASLTAE